MPSHREHPRRTAWSHPLALAAAACFLCLAALAAAVAQGITPAFDGDLLLLLRERDDLVNPLGPLWLERAARDVSGLGSVIVLGLLTLGGACLLWLVGNGWAAGCLVVAAGGAVLISDMTKDLIDRPRPVLVPHGDMALSASFPSGHATVSAAIFLTVGALLARNIPSRGGKTFALAFAASLACLVGSSRVYLGVHWPTDVIAGWLAGTGWACLCLLVANHLYLSATGHPRGPVAGKIFASRDAASGIDRIISDEQGYANASADLRGAATKNVPPEAIEPSALWEPGHARVEPGKISPETEVSATTRSHQLSMKPVGCAVEGP